MSRFNRSALRWLLVAAWMCVIFAGSSDSHSREHASRFIEPLVRWFLPATPEATIEQVVLFIRKCAHVSEYAVLTLLVWYALQSSASSPQPGFSWRTAGLTSAIAVLYAASDEMHQCFVPTRQGTPVDVLIDSVGVVFALLFLAAATRWRRSGFDSGGR